jgi:hypothetical protein
VFPPPERAEASSKTQEPSPVEKNTPTGAEALAEVAEQTNSFLLVSPELFIK